MFYRIVVRSELTERYADAFEGMKMAVGSGQTTLTGQVRDQSHLYGILNRASGLGLQLVSLEALPEYAKGERGAAGTTP